MKNIHIRALTLSFFLVVGLAFAAQADWEGRFPYGVAPLKLSLIQPIQLPIPWYGYAEESSFWGVYTICGLDLGLESSSRNVYGLSLGGLMWGGETMAGLDVSITSIQTDLCGLQVSGGAVAKEWAYGWQLGLFTYGREGVCGLQTGVLNMAGAVRGVQLGLANTSTDLKGVQLGLFNLNLGGPLVFFPFINVGF